MSNFYIDEVDGIEIGKKTFKTTPAWTLVLYYHGLALLKFFGRDTFTDELGQYRRSTARCRVVETVGKRLDNIILDETCLAYNDTVIDVLRGVY